MCSVSADCDDGDGNQGDLAGFDLVANDNDPGEISEVGTVDATYSFDPITAADSPRGILKNADLIKVSIEDTGRDKRTPVLLPVGGASTTISADDYAKITATYKNIGIDAQNFVAADDTADPVVVEVNVAVRGDNTADTVVEFTDEDGTTKTYHLADNMFWGDSASAYDVVGGTRTGLGGGENCDGALLSGNDRHKDPN